ncbi:cupin domain-containing protein [Martelella alba]|uniref:AraC family transcriptional regulator n=1 Tax=Martelella alba TaxID=2590451 RepID=A0ABY2SQY7_9HYPH|nr:AraC family transcriptional regulator [Martelella alba]
MDPLSELLTLLRPRHVVSAGVRTGGGWAIGFRGHAQQIKCYVVLRGTCRLAVEGIDEITRLKLPAAKRRLVSFLKPPFRGVVQKSV